MVHPREVEHSIVKHPVAILHNNIEDIQCRVLQKALDCFSAELDPYGDDDIDLAVRNTHDHWSGRWVGIDSGGEEVATVQ